LNAAFLRAVIRTLTNLKLRDLRWRMATFRRRIVGGMPVVYYFHQMNDPYSHLLWGPSFRIDDRPMLWGQDRIWMLEQDLIASL
jgi:hypothetical protein